ncbi:hypothetical protein HBI68_158350 [Parastagonospora nodorum]|nr:hypothetical protein HBH63_079030 [Parastagonospora nodorum]KAH5403579.1 hypothetical protein HBI32_164140 [Parastagonospora nodorum]KAH6153563.1 hypothetical protein HBI68_158350 [Parastagonospora nodorum]
MPESTKSTKSRDDAKDAQEKERETKSAARLAYGRQEGVSASPVGTKGQKRAGIHADIVPEGIRMRACDYR